MARSPRWTSSTPFRASALPAWSSCGSWPPRERVSSGTRHTCSRPRCASGSRSRTSCVPADRSWRRSRSLAACASVALVGSGRFACLALALLLAGLWWGSVRLTALDRSVLAARVGETARVQAVVTGPCPALALPDPRPGAASAARPIAGARGGAARAPAWPLAAAGSVDRDDRQDRAATPARGRVRRSRLPPTPRRARRAEGRQSGARSAAAAGSPGLADRLRASMARTPRSRPAGRAAGRACGRRARRGRGPLGRAPRQLPRLGPLPPPGGIRARTSCWSPADARARVAGRAAALARASSAALARDRRLRRRGRLAAVRRPRRGRGSARLARLAGGASARPLVLPAGRGGRPARVEPVQRARAGLPALVRGRRRDLRRRPGPRAAARGLPGPRRGSRRCSRSRSPAGWRRRRSSGSTSARSRSTRCRRTRSPGRRSRRCSGSALACTALHPVAPAARGGARVAERLAGRLRRRLRAPRRRPARARRPRRSRRSPARRARPARCSRSPADATPGAARRRRSALLIARDSSARSGCSGRGPRRLRRRRPADHRARRRPGRRDPAAGTGGERARRSGPARGERRRPARAAWACDGSRRSSSRIRSATTSEARRACSRGSDVDLVLDPRHPGAERGRARRRWPSSGASGSRS